MHHSYDRHCGGPAWERLPAEAINRNAHKRDTNNERPCLHERETECLGRKAARIVRPIPERPVAAPEEGPYNPNAIAAGLRKGATRMIWKQSRVHQDDKYDAADECIRAAQSRKSKQSALRMVEYPHDSLYIHETWRPFSSTLTCCTVEPRSRTDGVRHNKSWPPLKKRMDARYVDTNDAHHDKENGE